MSSRIMQIGRSLGLVALVYFLWKYQDHFRDIKTITWPLLLLLPLSFLSFLVYAKWLLIIGKSLGVNQREDLVELSVQSSILENIFPKGGTALKFSFFAVNASDKKIHSILLLAYPAFWNLALSFLLLFFIVPIEKFYYIFLPAVTLFPASFYFLFKKLKFNLDFFWSGAFYSICNYTIGVLSFVLAAYYVLPNESPLRLAQVQVITTIISAGGGLSTIPGLREVFAVLSAGWVELDKGAIFFITFVLRLVDLALLGLIALFFFVQARCKRT